MYNPTRRNRNIGTAKQGIKKNNRLTIPSFHYENLAEHRRTVRVINDHEFVFITEETRLHYEHACSIEDIVEVVSYIPKQDYGELRFFVLKQTKKKEEILSPCWGRWIPFYEYRDECYPAIILEALDYTKTIKWVKDLSVDSRKELNRLIADKHKVVEDKRHYIISYDLNSVRNTQLYRTIPHEFGHHVHYSQFESKEQWHGFPKNEKEKFAHSYAEDFMNKMRSSYEN